MEVVFGVQVIGLLENGGEKLGCDCEAVAIMALVLPRIAISSIDRSL